MERSDSEIERWSGSSPALGGRPLRVGPAVLVLVFAVLTTGWVLASHLLVEGWVEAHPWWKWIDVVGDLLFIVVTCVLLWWMSRRLVEAERQTRSRLARSEERLRITLDAIGDAVIATDVAGVVVRMNPAAERLSGTTSRAARGRPLGEVAVLRDEETGVAVADPVASVLARNAAITSGEGVVIHARDGTVCPVSDSAAPIRDPQGQVVGVVLVLRDQSQSRAAAMVLREWGALLEHRVDERTVELAEANRELEAFASSVSHDLRAPLRSLVGFAEALREEYDDRLDPQGRHWLETIDTQAKRMGHMIDDLLVLSRVTRTPLQRLPVDLSQVVRELFAELRESDPQRSVSCTVDPGIQVLGDPGLLRIAFTNLLGNAWKFTRTRAEGRITVQATPAAGGRLAISVSDNGVGFDPSFTATLFQPFQRLHKSDEFPGTGIGLATVARVVRRHGGEVTAEGRPEVGATFRLSLEAIGARTGTPTTTTPLRALALPGRPPARNG